MNNLVKRLISGIIGILLLILVVFKGGILLNFSVYFIAMIGLREFYKAIEIKNEKPSYILGLIISTAIFASFIYNIDYFVLVLSMSVLISLCSIVFFKKFNLESISITLIGTLYIPFSLFHILLLEDTKFIWLVFLIAFGTDTFAYVFGNLFGKRKLCPSISPKKTIAGSIGGILASIVIVLIYSNVYELGNLWIIGAMTFFGSIASQLGDFTASVIKRQAGIKDYGFIMPGHGGVMDRFDSIIFTGPLVYYIVSNFLI